MEKIPLMAIVGDKEKNDGSLSLRIHGQGDLGEMKIDTLLPRLKQLIQEKSLEIKI
jgi:threonyl-tRNA synthetase